MASILLPAAVGLCVVGVWLLILAALVRRRAGLPAGRVTYVDTGAGDRCERSLFSSRYRLTGRPDYLVQSRDGPVPVEVKSGPAPAQPYPAHVLQLAAYCLLVEEQEGRAPRRGILKYRDRAFEMDYSPAVRARLLRALDEMRQDLRAGDVDRSHRERGRCLRCGFRDRCDRRLA